MPRPAGGPGVHPRPLGAQVRPGDVVEVHRRPLRFSSLARSLVRLHRQDTLTVLRHLRRERPHPLSSGGSLGPAPVRQTHTQVFSPRVRARANGGRSRCAGGSDQSLEVSCPNVGKRGPGCTVWGWAGRELSPAAILRLQISWAFWRRGDRETPPYARADVTQGDVFEPYQCYSL